MTRALRTLLNAVWATRLEKQLHRLGLLRFATQTSLPLTTADRRNIRLITHVSIFSPYSESGHRMS